MNKVYTLVSDENKYNSYIVVKRFDAEFSLLYRIKNQIELESLRGILSLICDDNTQIIETIDPDALDEYKPYTKVIDLKALINDVNK